MRRTKLDQWSQELRDVRDPTELLGGSAQAAVLRLPSPEMAVDLPADWYAGEAWREPVGRLTSAEATIGALR